MEREGESRMHKLLVQNQEKENNSELLNNNLRFNYSSQPTLSGSLNFQSRGNIIRLKELPSIIHLDKKKAVGEPLRSKGSFEPQRHRSVLTVDPAPSTSETDNYTQEYAAELYSYLLSKDNRYGQFLKKHEIDQALRGRMIDWMVEVLTSYKCSHRTFFKTVDIMDRYCQLENRCLPIGKLHLVGVTAIYIATKIEEVYPIKLRTVEEKIAHKKLTEREILDKENDILRAMSFNVLGESIFDLACLLLCRVIATGWLRDAGVRTTEKKLAELEESLAHVAKVVLFSYSILSTYPKNVIATSVLLAVFTSSGMISPFLHDKVPPSLNVDC